MRQVILYSINKGKEIKVGETTYMGQNPVWTIHPNTKMPIKVQKGIPYVNMDKLKKKGLI